MRDLADMLVVQALEWVAARPRVYAYTDNDPLNLTDPSGQDSFGFYASIGAEAGIVGAGTSQQEGRELVCFIQAAAYLASVQLVS
jgi:hypothetical protein